MSEKSIVVISQDIVLSGIIERILEKNYRSFLFKNIQSAIDHIYNTPPNLIIFDTAEQDIFSMDIINNLKSDPIFYQLPVLVIIEGPESVPIWNSFLVEDYLKKSDLEKEGLIRVSLAILRSERIVEVNPLTKLPGNISISRQIQARIDSMEVFALAYADLDHFKPFNDHYGFTRGDDVIRITGRLILNIVKSKQPQGGFVGHIGGDDFVFIMSVDLVEETSEEIIGAFDRIIPTLYDKEDKERGFIETLDRQGHTRKFPITSLSIGIATNRNKSFTHFGEITEVASEMKKHAKQSWGSCYLTDRRVVSPG
ncbi:MAG TPA: diguanylate cyclase [Syntrophorhabdaceae bacterium]|nr:diguanylate cyclase [Syntrophorhabdaceae bacterium]